MTEAEAQRPHRRHLAPLDGLRGLALLIVFVFHWSLMIRGGEGEVPGGGRSLFFTALGAGWCGVDLFFVLSGFLITGILLDTRERSGFFQNFYARRTLRIFPLYYLFLAALFFVAAPHLRAKPEYASLLEDQGWFWTYGVNWLFALHGWRHIMFSHFWSLAVEEQFYLCWPLLVFAAGTKRVAMISAAIVVLSPLLRGGLYLFGGLQFPMAFLYTSLITRLDPLAWGALFACLLRLDGGAQWMEKKAGVLAISGGVLFVGLVALAGSDKETPVIAIAGFSCVALLFAGVLALVLTRGAGHWLNRALTMRWLREVGRVSYCAYLIHAPLLSVVWNHLAGKRDLLALLEAAALTAILSLASWRLLEAPLLRLKDRLAPPLGK